MDLRSNEMKTAVNEMSNFLRSEDIGNDYLNLFAGENVLNSVFNIKNQIIYGRRGTGKTHLLKALEELCYKTLYTKKMYPVYIDLRKVSTPPASTPSDYKLSAVIYFQNILNTIVETVFNELDFIINPLNQLESYKVNLIKSQLSTELNKLGVILNGNKIQKQGEFSINFEKITNLNGEVGFKRFLGKGGFQKKTVESQDGYSYINFGLIANTMDEIIKALGLHHMIILLDEWSEIDINTQPFLSSLLKSSFVSSSVKIKIGAIKYRTKLLEEVIGNVTYGLEDGGDIFGEDLDNKYVYEINMVNTRAYFSELLYKHLVRFNNNVESYWSEKNNRPLESFLNDIFTPQALKEILIGSAGVSRDFLNIFLNAHQEFLSETEQKITVKHVRRATQSWYRLDKQNRIDNSPSAKKLLEKIVNYVIRDKKVTHFLVSQSSFDNEYLQRLVDLRVIHMRKRGYSHQDNAGVVYDVYSVDYGCYTNNNFTAAQLDIKGLEDLEVIEDFREIRRIAVEEKFFLEHKLEVGEGIKCTACKGIVDTTHPAYIKHNLCNNCWEPYDNKQLKSEENV